MVIRLSAFRGGQKEELKGCDKHYVRPEIWGFYVGEDDGCGHVECNAVLTREDASRPLALHRRRLSVSGACWQPCWNRGEPLGSTAASYRSAWARGPEAVLMGTRTQILWPWLYELSWVEYMDITKNVRLQLCIISPSDSWLICFTVAVDPPQEFALHLSARQTDKKTSSHLLVACRSDVNGFTSLSTDDHLWSVQLIPQTNRKRKII